MNEGKKIDSFDNAKNIIETTKITTLNIDCLESIFEHLEFNDLINVADTSKHFYSAVCLVYKRKYVNMDLLFDKKLYYSFLNWAQDVGRAQDGLEPNPVIFLTNPIILFKLLRNFGHLIKNLGINFNNFNVKICTEIENYLAEYCSNSLQRFSLVCHSTKFPFDELRKPLKNVIGFKVEMILEQKLNHIQFLNESNLPNVQYFFISSIGDICKSLEKEIHYEKIEYVTIVYSGSTNFHKFSCSFGNLKHLTIAGSVCLNDALCESISNIKHLKTLKIMNLCYLNSDSFSKLLKLPNILSNVVEMQFKFEKGMSAEVVLDFLKQSRNVRKLSFHVEAVKNVAWVNQLKESFYSEMRTISSNLNDEWKVYVIDAYRNPFQDFVKVNKYYVIERLSI